MSETSESSAINQPQTPPPARPQAAAASPASAQTSRPSASSAQRGIVRSVHYTLSYIAQNAERGPRGAIVLLHDLPGGAFVWERILPALAATGHAVYAFDMLGFGQSDKPWPADTSVWGHADVLSYAFRTLGLTDITLVGFGLGGGVAQTLATRLYREDVARLALINSYAYEYAFAPNWPFPDMAKHQDPELAHHMKAEEALNELRQTLPNGTTGNLSGERLNAYLSEWNTDLGKNVIMQQVRNMLPLYENSVATDLVMLDRPLLLIWSERDAVTPLSLAQRIASEARDARLEVISGAGHLLLDEAPDKVATLLASFAS
ncbi:MAG TPA: alpha/beta hydrolase [Ktedonobacterales bacterium]